MKEKLPPRDENVLNKLQASADAGIERQRQDEADPILGPIMRMVDTVRLAAANSRESWDEFETIKQAFPKQFENPREARRYRLYHFLLGSSTPPDSADLFDAEGAGSIAEGMRTLAETYHIDIGIS